MENYKLMKNAKITSLLWKFSLPAIVGMLVNALYNIIDRIFVGNASDLGTNGLAGMTVVFPIFMIIMAVSLTCGVGGAALFSISMGEKKYKKANNIIGNAFALALLLTFLVAVFFFSFMDPILKQFGASETVLPYSKAYLSMILLGAMFQGWNMTGNNLIRANGSPKISMLSIILGVCVNCILAPLFIYVFKWGMTGCGLATILGMLSSSIWIFIYFYRSQHKFTFKKLLLKKDLSKGIFITGLPAFCIQFAGSAFNMVLNASLIKYGGDIAVSSMGLVNSVQTLVALPIIGLNQGALPIIGFNFGAKDFNRVISTVKISAVIATIMSIIGFIITHTINREIIMIFNRDPELIKMGSYFLWMWFLAFPLVGVGMVGGNYFQSIGKAVPAIFLSLTRQVIILIPLIFILPNFFGLDGVVMAQPIADVSSTFIGVTCLILSLKKLKKEMNSKNT
ncbi:MAG: MATE family efflux transporter [Bacilli bacterium]|jgi:putative MATE family efflux protein|nr:MATE family efflux transporter [Bacilli bacterium]